MRIRKKWPLPSLNPNFPRKTRFRKISPFVPSQQEKIGVSSSTTISTKTPKGLHYDRCFSVVEENRRIGWSCFQSNKSLHRLIEEDGTSSNLQLVNPKGVLNGSARYDLNKEAFQGEVGAKVTKKSRSTLTGSYRKKRNNSSVKVTASLVLSSSSSHRVERWCDEEKTIPVKKRRGRYRLRRMIMKKKEEMVTKMKAKRTCNIQEDNNEDRGPVLKKRRMKGNILMEGSRCSRVNGKGWRCSQKTLVGYALCQHHLGWTKIKSMSSINVISDSSVASGANMDNNNSNKPSTSSLHRQNQQEVSKVIDETKIRKKMRTPRECVTK